MNFLRLVPKMRSRSKSKVRRNRRVPLGIDVDSLESRILLTAGTTPAAPLELGMNVDPVAYYSTSLEFVDVMKMAADKWNVTSASTPGWPWNISNVALPPMDQNGYPIGLGKLPASGYALDTFVFTNLNGYYPTGTYTLTFDGSGTVKIADGVDPYQVFTQSGGLGTPHNVTISATSKLGIVVAITSSDPSDYVRNIRLVMPGFQNTYETEPFNPQYLRALEPFTQLRFVDVMVNNSPTQNVGMTWADETPVTYRTQAKSTGMSVQYIVELCNILDKNMWVNMPVGATSNLRYQFREVRSRQPEPWAEGIRRVWQRDLERNLSE